MAARGRASAKKPAQTAVERSEVGSVTEWLRDELAEQREVAQERIGALSEERDRWYRILEACSQGLEALDSKQDQRDPSDVPF